ncbi:MAG: hypothetical protein O2960_28555 [Verrucomicrobia bacterium]|nr:hypothetical protein [Verrucomicrobiota bacterium]
MKRLNARVWMAILAGILALDGARLRGAETNAGAATLETRTKAAQRPWDCYRITCIQVKPGKEDAWLSCQKEWLEINNELARRGKIRSNSVWKAADPKAAGYDFASITLFYSLSDANNYTREEIEGFFGKEKLEDLIRRTGDFRTVISSSIEQLVDYTTLVRSESDPSFSQALLIGSMRATPGRERDYEKMEKTVFSKFWQKMAVKDPHLVAWFFSKQVSSFKAGEGRNYTIVHLLDPKLTAPSQKQTDELQEQAWKEAELPSHKSLDVKGLREMGKVVTVNKVMETQPDLNPVRAEWKKLLGNWKASIPDGHFAGDGGYRIKRISMGHEDLEIYDKNGKLERKMSCPMKIEVREGLNHFYSLHHEGTYHSIYKIHDDVWYEQSRAIFTGDTKTRPDAFLVYKRIDK